jgi:hypothetical protein
MNGKQFVIATVFAMVLLIMVFIPKSSQLGTYDPWLDINDDGKIDIKDLATTAKAYGTTGTPINKTQLLLELKARTDALNASVIELQSRKRVVAGQTSGKPDLTLDQPMPYLSGANESNTIVVASGVGNLSGHTNPTPLAVKGQVTRPNTIRFAVYDVYGNEYDPNDASWNSIEINYIVIDR